MTLQDEIDALPKWSFLSKDQNLHAALARLALAREVIRTRVQIRSDSDYDEITCLLKALEVPR